MILCGSILDLFFLGATKNISFQVILLVCSINYSNNEYDINFHIIFNGNDKDNLYI